MPEPQYPTSEGIWSRGQRTEESYERVRLGVPYTKAVDNFRAATQDRTDFDPAAVFVWGTMQANAVLNTLKAVEKAFGERGQEVVREAINAAGYEAAKGMLEDSDFPENLDEMERISYLITGINTVLYASLEKPWITSDNRCEFDILWCPHQDLYTAFDCRVQRYFVEGMLRALNDHAGVNAHPQLTQLIPRGADCCHFVVDKLDEDAGDHPWDAYSDELAKRALEKLDESDT